MDRRLVFAGGLLTALAAVYCARVVPTDRTCGSHTAPDGEEPALLALPDVRARQLVPEPGSAVVTTAFPFRGRRSADSESGPELGMPGEAMPELAAPVIEIPSVPEAPAAIAGPPSDAASPAEALPTAAPPEAASHAPVAVASPSEPAPAFSFPTNPPAATEQPAEVVAAVTRVQRLTAYGRSLSERGAIYSARSQFVQALRELAEAYDAAEGTLEHSHALNAALRAIQESHDFERRNAMSADRVEVAQLVAGHRTSVLKGRELADMRPAEAIEIYQQHAIEQLTAAVNQSPTAALPMYGLGRISTAPMTGQLPTAAQDAEDAIVWYQAALQTDPCNAPVAHELGTLYARRGQWQIAKSVLQRAVTLQSHPTTWANLALVHTKLGEEEWARAAQSHAAQGGSATKLEGKLPPVQWVDAETFAKSTGPNEAYFPQQTPPPTTAHGAPAAEPRSATKPKASLSWLPWNKHKQR